MLTRRLAALAAILLGITGCVDSRTTPTPQPEATPEPAPASPTMTMEDINNLPPFHFRLLTIAQNYQTFGQVEDRLRWAPAMCAAPPRDEDLLAKLRFSASKDAESHGSKLYALFAIFKENGSYIQPGKPSMVNQEIVKESWIPEEVRDDGKPLEPAIRKVPKYDYTGCSFQPKPTIVEEKYLPYARKDGKLYRASKQGDLFIMFKMEPDTPNTDQGWVYGTVTADGKKVTSAGRVASCMKCHEQAPHDRLFGLPRKK
jgi:hypothetical protein